MRTSRLLLAGVIAAAAACSGGSETKTPPQDAGTGGTAPMKKPVFANAHAATDPLYEGETYFLEETWGLEELDAWPPAAFMLGLMTAEPDVFGDQFARFGFITDPNDDLPIGLKRGSTNHDKVYGTCALCHTAPLDDGRKWLGAPNRKLELGRFQIEVNKRWVAAGNKPLMDDFSLKKAAQLGAGRIGAEPGPDPLIPDDIPVAFNLSKRTYLSKLGTGHNIKSEVYLSLFGFGAGYPDTATAKVPFPDEDRLAKFIDAFGSYDPPAGPAQDAALVQQGKAAFEAAQCSSCHKVGDLAAESATPVDKAPDGLDRIPGADPAYPDGSIHTDAIHFGLADPSGGGGGAGGAGGAGGGLGYDPGFAAYVTFIFHYHLSVGPSPGYRIPDLRGAWASAPYLHNGSVPTLEDLLQPTAKRPASWSPVPGFTLDVSQAGNGNQGHEFGTTLSDADKQALVAYLKSL